MNQHAHPPPRELLAALATDVRDGPVDAGPARPGATWPRTAWTALAERWAALEGRLGASGLADEGHLVAVRGAFRAMLEAPSEECRHALFLLVTALAESLPPEADP